MKIVSADDLSSADLRVDAIYEGGRKGNAGDDPLPRLMRVDSQGGFRYRGKVKGKLDLLVLWTSMDNPDWPDSFDPETGIFTYYGDNKEAGRNLHETGRDGNLILKTVFEDSRAGEAGRMVVPPIFLFAKAGPSRDVKFLGLAVPGASDLDASEELVAIWRSMKGERYCRASAYLPFGNLMLILPFHRPQISKGTADGSAHDPSVSRLSEVALDRRSGTAWTVCRRRSARAADPVRSASAGN